MYNSEADSNNSINFSTNANTNINSNGYTNSNTNGNSNSNCKSIDATNSDLRKKGRRRWNVRRTCCRKRKRENFCVR